jgi:ABC-type proline/glycine betaine transport system permease subunit
MQGYWFLLLLSSICLEGLGRKYLPGIPSAAFYFFKDFVLLLGFVRYPAPLAVSRVVKLLYRGFTAVWLAGFLWTLIEIFNPEHQSLPLAFLGLRAYWFWWIAPAIIAGVLHTPKQKRRAIYVLVFLSFGICTLAAAQFASPSTSALNLYTVQDGQEIYADAATVGATGRPRVASTFAFLTGFANFTILVPALLLSIGLETQDRRLRWFVLGATLLTASTVPMAGSRSSVLLGALILAITAYSAGLFFTVIGRRIMIGAIAGAVLAIVAFPDAFIGVQSRFDNQEETVGRLSEFGLFIPPVALLTLNYPMMGLGTGMQQNARASMGVWISEWDSESESHRLLIELGPVGFCLIWTAKLGLTIALLRARMILKDAGRRAAAGAALSYAMLTMIGSLEFDHIWQSLYFVGCGFILAEVVNVLEEQGRTGHTLVSAAA